MSSQYFVEKYKGYVIKNKNGHYWALRVPFSTLNQARNHIDNHKRK